MKNFYLLLFFTSTCIYQLTAQNKILWNGEGINDSRCNYSSGYLDATNFYSGKYCFRAESDKWHSPSISFSCSDFWRSDISRFDELRFYIKSDLPDQTTSICFSTWYAKGNWLDLTPYIVGGGKISTNYKLVKIPLSILKTKDYDLSSIQELNFFTSETEQKLYIDDITLWDLTPANISSFQFISDKVIKLNISERHDKTDCYNLANYELSSATDPNYVNSQQPIKIGRHNYVEKLLPISGSPVVKFELFLIFSQSLKNNQSYTLKIKNIKDLANNNWLTSKSYTFTFSDNTVSGSVKANQVGYLPQSPKYGKLGNFLGDAWFLEINELKPPSFEVRDALTNGTVYKGISKFLKADSTFSGEKVFDLDFSSFQKSGEFYLYVPGYGKSYNFRIADDVFDKIYYHTARTLYYQRTGDLKAPYAEENWLRKGYSMVNAEMPSFQTSSPLYKTGKDYPVGSILPMSEGWFDAGDYGRYVPTAASALYNLFTAFELYPEKFPDGFNNIPESGNKIPDILDEIKHELDWLMNMQASDGGVYYRVTTKNWASGLPEEETNPLYVSEKTTQSTALYAATMAMAYRSFIKYLPGYAITCLVKAEKAWAFLAAHPDISGPISASNINAGGYGDNEDKDNRAWAAAELYKSTGNPNYHKDFIYWWAKIPHYYHAVLGWQQHTTKAAWVYATTTYTTDPIIVNDFKKDMSDWFDNYIDNTMNIHAYHGAYPSYKGYIGFGHFGMSQQYAFWFIMYSYLLNKPEYLDYAKIQLDIPLGNNPLSRTFITGIGNENASPKQPLHWSTISDKYTSPVPGIPVFGPSSSLSFGLPHSKDVLDSANLYPYGYGENNPYPILRKYSDLREIPVFSEFTIEDIAVTIASFAYFSSAAVFSQPSPSDAPTNFIVFPNPAKDRLTIKIPENEKTRENYKLEMYNLLGELVYKQYFTPDNFGLFTLTDIKNFTKGLYILTLTNPTKTITNKIFIE